MICWPSINRTCWHDVHVLASVQLSLTNLLAGHWSLLFRCQQRLQARQEIRPQGKSLIFLVTLPNCLNLSWPVVFAVTDHLVLVALPRSLILTWPVVFAAADHSFLVAFSGGLDSRLACSLRSRHPGISCCRLPRSLWFIGLVLDW